MRAAARGALVAVCAVVACKRGGEAPVDGGAPPTASEAPPPVVAEPVPRCRPDGAGLPIPGEDVVVG